RRTARSLFLALGGPGLVFAALVTLFGLGRLFRLGSLGRLGRLGLGRLLGGRLGLGGLLLLALAFVLLFPRWRGLDRRDPQLGERHRRGVAQAHPRRQDAGVPARAAMEPRRDLVEQLAQRLGLLHHPARHAHGVHDRLALIGAELVLPFLRQLVDRRAP